jgi:hypothetical protein
MLETLLVRNGVADVGNGDEPNRPIEHPILRLDNLAEMVWAPAGRPSGILVPGLTSQGRWLCVWRHGSVTMANSPRSKT